MTDTYNYGISNADASIFGAAMLGYLVVLLVIYILVVIAMWKVFTKAGKPGWASLIPVYNMVVMYQIVGLNPWLLLLYLIPVVNWIAALVLSIMQNVKLAKAFGKSTGFAIGLIFLNPIFLLILGFGDAKYVGCE